MTHRLSVAALIQSITDVWRVWKVWELLLSGSLKLQQLNHQVFKPPPNIPFDRTNPACGRIAGHPAVKPLSCPEPPETSDLEVLQTNIRIQSDPGLVKENHAGSSEPLARSSRLFQLAVTTLWLRVSGNSGWGPNRGEPELWICLHQPGLSQFCSPERSNKTNFLLEINTRNKNIYFTKVIYVLFRVVFFHVFSNLWCSRNRTEWDLRLDFQNKSLVLS